MEMFKLKPTTPAADAAKYIETIELQNQKLNEIAWIQSHILRTPVAGILGLIDIIGDFKEKEDIATVLQYISQSAHEVDAVIRDISSRSIPIAPGMIA